MAHPQNKGQSQTHVRYQLLTAPLPQSQNTAFVRLPDRDGAFRSEAPNDDPAVRVAGGEIGVLVEELQGVDGGRMAAEDVGRDGGRVYAW